MRAGIPGPKDAAQGPDAERIRNAIAHDFNNLLTAINGYSELGLGMTGQDGQLYSFFKKILDAGKRAAFLTNQLLAHSRKQILMPKVLD